MSERISSKFFKEMVGDYEKYPNYMMNYLRSCRSLNLWTPREKLWDLPKKKPEENEDKVTTEI